MRWCMGGEKITWGLESDFTACLHVIFCLPACMYLAMYARYGRCARMYICIFNDSLMRMPLHSELLLVAVNYLGRYTLYMDSDA